MVRIFCIIVISTLASHYCAAKPVLGDDTAVATVKILYIVESGDKQPVPTRYAFIDKKCLDGWNILAASDCKPICQPLEVDYVFIYKLKPNTKVLTYDNFLNVYKIQSKYRKLPVMVDDEIIDYPETMLISQNQIAKVKIIKCPKGFTITITLVGYEEFRKKLNNKPVLQLEGTP